jgi:hypothetical protein
VLLRAQEQRLGLGDEACVVDGTTGLGQGRWRHLRASTVVGNDDAEASGGLDDDAEAPRRT